MTFLRVIFTIAISFLYVAGFDSYVVAASPGLNSSFKKLVGDTEWEIKLKDFGLRLVTFFVSIYCWYFYCPNF